MTLPADLLQAISSLDGGRMVLVVGAGCSLEAPTGLPLSRECASEAHRQLLANGVLTAGDCDDPTDLSKLADAVLEKTTLQRPLVECLPLADFRNAQANEGYLLAAAMLREHSLVAILTLNFDLALQSALAQLNARDVAVITGPENHHRLGVVNLIFLHRNVDADPEKWILRTAALDEDWRDQWEEVVVARVVGAPVTVFAGLGTRVAVLVEAARRIRQAVPAAARVYQVDPGDRADSAFADVLDLDDASYLQMGWSAFMKELSERVVEEHRAELERSCTALVASQGLEPETVGPLLSRFAGLGLLDLGQIRARWLTEQNAYAPRRTTDPAHIADLLLALVYLERRTSLRANFQSDGVVELRDGDRIVSALLLASGRGIDRWASIEAKLTEQRSRRRDPRARFGLVAGVSGGRTNIAPPPNIATGSDSDSIVTGPEAFEMYSVDELRSQQDLAERLAG